MAGRIGNTRRKALLGLLSAVVLTTSVACGARGDEVAEQPAPVADEQLALYEPGVFPAPDAGDPVAGGTLTFADAFEGQSFDPARTTSSGQAGGTVLVALYDQLIRFDPEAQEFVPHLAESLEANDDATEWTLTLRDNVTFSDGTPLDADAALFSMSRYLDLRVSDETSSVRANLHQMRKVDARTIVFEFNRGFANFEAQLALGLGMIVHPDTADNPESYEPIGAGPFVFGSYQPQEELILERNEDYWGGAPYLDALRFVWLRTPEATAQAFRSGDVDAIQVYDPKEFEQLRGDDTAGYVGVQGLGSVLIINGQEGRDGAYPQVRQAIAHALNIEEMQERVHGGAGLTDRHLFNSLSRWNSPDVPVREYDPEAARELVEEAKAAGFDGTVQIVGLQTPVNREEALAIKAYLEAVGFTVEEDLLRTPADNTRRVYVDKDFDLTRTQLSVYDHDPHRILYGRLHSDSPSQLGVPDPEMDELLDELQATPLAEADDVLRRIEERFQDNVPFVALGPRATLIGWAPNVHGVVASNDMLTGWEKAWLSS